MTTYTMTGPDGRDYSIDGPPGATPTEVAAQMQQHFGAQQSASAPTGPSDEGRLATAFRTGADSLTFGAANPIAAALAAGVSHLVPGIPNQSYNQALRGIKAQQAADVAANPLSAVGGTIAGAISPAAAIERGGAVLARAVAPRLADRIGAALTVREGAPLTNIARRAGQAALAGAGFGGIQGAAQSIAGQTNEGVLPSAVTGGALGGLAGGALGGVAGAAGAAGKYGVDFLKGGDNAAKNIVLRSAALPGEAPPDTTRRLLQIAQDYKNTYGITPALSEILGIESGSRAVRPLAKAIASNPAAANTAASLEDRLATQRQHLLSNVIAKGGPLKSSQALYDEASAALTADLRGGPNPVVAQRVTPQGADAQFLKNNAADIQSLFRGKRGQVYDEARTAWDNYVDEKTHSLPVGAIETLRYAASKLGGGADAVTAHAFSGIAAGLRDLGAQNSGYAKAFAKYAPAMRVAENIPIGAKAIGNAAAPLDVTADFGGVPTTPLEAAQQVGQQIGGRSALAQRSLQSPEATVGLAEDLSHNAGLGQNLTTLFGPQEAARLQNAGKTSFGAAQGANATVPRTAAPTAAGDARGAALRASLFAAHGGSTQLMAGIIEHAVNVFRYPPGTAQKVAEDALDPAKTAKVLNFMRRSGVSAAKAIKFIDDIRAAQTAGVAAAHYVNQGQ